MGNLLEANRRSGSSAQVRTRAWFPCDRFAFELVALGIGKHRPDESWHLMLSYCGGPKADKARDLRRTGAAGKIYVNPVLSRAWFGHPLQPEHRAAVGRPL